MPTADETLDLDSITASKTKITTTTTKTTTQSTVTLIKTSSESNVIGNGKSDLNLPTTVKHIAIYLVFIIEN